MSNKKYFIFDVDDVVTSNLKEISQNMASILSNENFEVGFIQLLRIGHNENEGWVKVL